jgi:hypothetical protein
LPENNWSKLQNWTKEATWLNIINNMKVLEGKKTYITAAGGILAAVGAYLSGDMEIGAMVQIIITSLLAIFLRKGIKTDTNGGN